MGTKATGVRACSECSGKALCINSRPMEGFTYRRYRCCSCGHRWNTHEYVVPSPRQVALRQIANDLLEVATRLDRTVE